MDNLNQQSIKAYTLKFDRLRLQREAANYSLFLLRLSNTTGGGYILIEELTSGWWPAFYYTDGRRRIEAIAKDDARIANLQKAEAVAINGQVFQIDDSDSPGIFSNKPIYYLICRASGETWTPAP